MDVVGTHQRCLIAAAMRTKGPILELGCGWYSTPLLHEIATIQGRYLTTIDNNAYWLKQFAGLANEYHKIELVGWWGDAEYDSHYGLVFIDQGQPIEREYAIRRLINSAAVFVMHDTEEGFAYGYERTLPLFVHKITDKTHRAHTTIASNVIDVSRWIVNLPLCTPVELIHPESPT